MKAKYTINKRYLPLHASVHPVGGFVAWPEDKNISDQQRAIKELSQRRRDRRGFVAWPQKETKAA